MKLCLFTSIFFIRYYFWCLYVSKCPEVTIWSTKKEDKKGTVIQAIGIFRNFFLLISNGKISMFFEVYTHDQIWQSKKTACPSVLQLQFCIWSYSQLRCLNMCIFWTCNKLQIFTKLYLQVVGFGPFYKFWPWAIKF